MALTICTARKERRRESRTELRRDHSRRQEGAVGPLQESDGQKLGRSTRCHSEAWRGLRVGSG